MPPGRLVFSIIVLLPLTVSCLTACSRQPVARDGVMDLRGRTALLQAEVLRLDGDWEFYWRQFIRHADSRGSPLLVPVPESWTHFAGASGHTAPGQGRPDADSFAHGFPARGFASYRLRLLLDEPRTDMAFQVLDAAMAYRLYLNGNLIVSEGRAGRTRATTVSRTAHLMSGPVALDRENEIILEVANFQLHEGGLRKSVRLGSYAIMRAQRERSIGLNTMLIGMLGFTALFQLLLFSFERRETAALFFVALCVAMILRIAMTNERLIYRVWPELDSTVYLKILIPITYSFLPSSLFLLRFLFPEVAPRRSLYALSGATGALCLVVVLTEPEIYMHTVLLFIPLGLGAVAYGLYVLIRALRRRTADSGLFLFAFLSFLPMVFNDMFHSVGLLQTRYVAQYGFAAFILFQTLIVPRRLLRSLRLARSLAEELKESNERLRSLDRLKDEFLAVTSHELRTPLQGIIGIADSIRDRTGGLESGELDRRLELIVSSGRRLADLVGDILDFSALRYGDIRLNPAPIDLGAFARQQLALIAYNVDPRQKLELRNEVPADLPPVLADEARLTQIVQNLLANAVKHTGTGRITIAARPVADERIEVRVEDTGTGIEPERLERIFRPFEQGGAPGTAGGIGLGLSIARVLVELHGASLQVDSRPGAGSSFYFTLPVSRERTGSPATGSQELSPPLLAGVRTVAEAGTSILTPRKTEQETPDLPLILLVDDEPVNIEVMRAYLQGVARVVSARNVAEARDCLRENQPDCLVLDLMMPVSGLDLLRELRAERSLIELPVLIVTALTRTGTLMEALELGANDYLTKPFEKEDFLLRVANLAALSRAHRGRNIAVREAARQERERINADIHDHLGASLTDLKIMTDRALRDPELKQEFTLRLRDKVAAVIRILRHDLLGLEDLELLEENFLEGLQLILLRRYVEAGREFDMQIPADHADLVDPEQRLILFAVLKEVVTNDLKYGAGPATLRFRRDAGLEIEFESLSHYRLETHRTGRGTASMIRRLSTIGGTLQMQIDSEAPATPRAVRIRIHLPK